MSTDSELLLKTYSQLRKVYGRRARLEPGRRVTVPFPGLHWAMSVEPMRQGGIRLLRIGTCVTDDFDLDRAGGSAGFLLAECSTWIFGRPQVAGAQLQIETTVFADGLKAKQLGTVVDYLAHRALRLSTDITLLGLFPGDVTE